MIQALADGGVKMGLNRDQSLRLAAQSMLVSPAITNSPTRPVPAQLL